MNRRRNKKNKSFISGLFVFITILLVVSVGLSFLAPFSWFFDLFSNFVLQYTAIGGVLALLLVLSRRTGWAMLALLVTISQGVQLIPMFKPQMAGAEKYEDIKVLQYNVHRGNNNVDQITKWIISQSETVDVVALLEVNDKWQDSIERIKWAYPYHISKDMRGGRKMVLLSKLFIDEIEVKYFGESDSPAIVLRGETVGYEMPFVIYGMHPPPPVLPSYAKRRNELLMESATSMAKEKADYKIILADFNTTRFSPNFKKMTKTAGLYDSNIGQGFVSTWPKRMGKFFGIAIDNILLSDNIIVNNKEIGPSMGSDHFPVISSLRFIPKEGTRDNLGVKKNAAL
jgi:endonuclease/exonuclease/phosphatase (EEP) superfamily protein YafD